MNRGGGEGRGAEKEPHVAFWEGGRREGGTVTQPLERSGRRNGCSVSGRVGSVRQKRDSIREKKHI